jgi:hypothetical protein
LILKLGHIPAGLHERDYSDRNDAKQQQSSEHFQQPA